MLQAGFMLAAAAAADLLLENFTHFSTGASATASGSVNIGRLPVGNERRWCISVVSSADGNDPITRNSCTLDSSGVTAVVNGAHTTAGGSRTYIDIIEMPAARGTGNKTLRSTFSPAPTGTMSALYVVYSGPNGITTGDKPKGTGNSITLNFNVQPNDVIIGGASCANGSSYSPLIFLDEPPDEEDDVGTNEWTIVSSVKHLGSAIAAQEKFICSSPTAASAALAVFRGL